ncbi:MAG: hypothetical protein HY719_07300 [Planctomycetes bacterium]|nr:hypothetical protein [Planctomycetota bacterium]
MGLRIGTNVSALNALRNLNDVSAKQATSVSRLSSGLRIQKASDDPGGLVLSEALRAQISGIKASQTSVARGSNLLSTADAALASVSNLLLNIKSSIDSSIGADASTTAANQSAVDSAIQSIENLRKNTTFGGRYLFNGQSSISVTSVNNASYLSTIKGIRLESLDFGGNSTRTIDVNVTQAASRATQVVAGVAVADDFNTGVQFLLTGPKGTAVVTLAGTYGSAGAVAELFGAFSGTTGVFASVANLSTLEFGSNQSIQVTQLTAAPAAATYSFTIGGSTFANTTAAGTANTKTAGTDFAGNVGGITAAGDGTGLSVSSSSITGRIELDANTLVTAQTGRSFTAQKSGADIQLGPQAGNSLNVAMPSLNPSELGTFEYNVFKQNAFLGGVGGTLDSIKSGGGNALASDLTNAGRIVDAVMNQITVSRARLGGMQKDVVDARASQLDTEMANLSAVQSVVRDVDFASEISEFTKNQVLFQSAVSALAAANSQSASVLTLLGG